MSQPKDNPRKDWNRAANYVRAMRILRAAGRLALANEMTEWAEEMESL